MNVWFGRYYRSLLFGVFLMGFSFPSASRAVDDVEAPEALSEMDPVETYHQTTDGVVRYRGPETEVLDGFDGQESDSGLYDQARQSQVGTVISAEESGRRVVEISGPGPMVQPGSVENARGN